MLTLPIKGKYFKMIESGEKKNGYRCKFLMMGQSLKMIGTIL